MITEEQLAALLRMGDIGGAQEDLSNQMLLANQLRNTMGGIKRNDWGANLGRAAYGGAGAISDYRAMKARPEITQMKKNLLSELLRKRGAPTTGYGMEGPY